MHRLFNRFLSLETPSPLTLEARRCLRARCHDFDCRRCLDVCPSGALSLVDKRIVLDHSACTACMRCTAVCPNDALVATVDIAALLADLPADDEIFFSCRRQPLLRARERVLPCIAQFSPEALVYAGMRGPAKILFNVSACSECVNGAGAAAFFTSLDRVRSFLGSHLKATFILFPTDQKEKDGATINRRDFLVGLKTAISSGSMPTATPEPVNTSRRIPSRLRLLQQALHTLPPADRKTPAATCNPRLTVSEACNLCPRCAGICPTGALRLVRDGGRKKLVFEARHCSGCGLCAAFCKAAALSLTCSPLAPTTTAENEKNAD